MVRIHGVPRFRWEGAAKRGHSIPRLTTIGMSFREVAIGGLFLEIGTLRASTDLQKILEKMCHFSVEPCVYFPCTLQILQVFHDIYVKLGSLGPTISKYGREFDGFNMAEKRTPRRKNIKIIRLYCILHSVTVIIIQTHPLPPVATNFNHYHSNP